MNKINKILWGFVILAMILVIYNIINKDYNYKNCAGSMSCNILRDKLNISYKIIDKIDLYGLFIMPSGLIIGIILSIKEIKLLEEETQMGRTHYQPIFFKLCDIMNKRKIVICVWNDIDKDDRVMKKAITLSKKFNVIVKSVCKCKKADTNPRENKFVRIVNDNLIIEYYWFNSFFEWLYYRLLDNTNFWSDKITYADMYDCNDPDTLCAGVFAKEKYNSKILYDSHEFWQGTRRKEYNLLYTIYSYIGNTIQYHREKSLVHNVNGITTVSESIANILRYKYNKPVCVIENRATLNKYRIGNYENIKIPSVNAVFFGSKIRPGTIDTLLTLKKEGFKPMIIGDYSNDKLTDLGIECLGFLDKDSYQKELAKSCVAVLDFEVTCDNIKYCLPNKLFEYIQAGIPIIANDRLFDVSRFIKDKKIGVVCNVYNIKDKIREIITEYHKYRHNINNISYEYSWENQEKQLLSYYSLFMDVE